MKRFLLAILAIGLSGLASAQTPPTRLESVVGTLRALGADIQVIPPFADAGLRSLCGYPPAAGQTIHVMAWGWKLSGPAEPIDNAVQHVVAVSADEHVHCYDRLELADLRFEDGAVVGATMKIQDRNPKLNLASQSHVTFGYEWRRMRTHIALEMDARDIRTTKSLAFSTELRFSGIDLMALQENHNARQMPHLAFLTASLQSFRLKFYDRGLRDVLLDIVARETGSTPRRLQRDAILNLEQARVVLAGTGIQVLSEAIDVVQDTILDGGGGEIVMEPNRPVPVLDFVAALESQSRDRVVDLLNMTIKRLP